MICDSPKKDFDADNREGVAVRSLLYLFCVAVLLRILLFTVSSTIHGMDIHVFAELRDGFSYIEYAKAIAGEPHNLTVYDQRVFPGYPFLIALLHEAEVPFHIGALAMNWLSIAVAAILSALVFNDIRIGYAMAVLTPSHLMYTTVVMSEATLLAFTMTGIFLVSRYRSSLVAVVLAGVILGVAGTIRPTACFAVLGVMACLCWNRRWWAAALLGTVSLGVVIGAALQVKLWFGDALRSYHLYTNLPDAYDGQLLTWPFTSLVLTPLKDYVPLWKIGYIYLHVVIVIGGMGLLLHRLWVSLRSHGTDVDRNLLFACWLAFNTFFVLCIGNIWGFHEFQRFILPALPPLAYALSPWLPLHWYGWGVVVCVNFPLALFGLSRVLPV